MRSSQRRHFYFDNSLAESKKCNYDVIMKAQIIQIGNSQGIRIPKILLEESRLGREVELEVREDGIMIRRASKPRSGWDAKFRSLSDIDDDHRLQQTGAPEFDAKEWQW